MSKPLGLKLKSRYGDYFAQIEAPGTTITLHPSSKKGPQADNSESLSIGFGVENLEAALVEFKEKGVEFSSGIVQDGSVRLAFFTDPDNNPLYLSQTQTWQ
jgi:predicted enzyme related to lactoylglutathione lyase